MKKLFILITLLAAFSTTSNAELMSEDEGYEVFLKTKRLGIILVETTILVLQFVSQK